MEALLKEQELTIKRTERILVNYKKLGKANFSVPTAEDRLHRLRGEWTTCTRLHLELELKATAEARKGNYFTECIYEQAEGLYEQATDFFIEVIASAKTASATVTEQKTSVESSSLARLPRIPLPRFAGVITEWPSFADFEPLVINDRGLDDVQKLHYLQGSFEGEIRDFTKCAA